MLVSAFSALRSCPGPGCATWLGSAGRKGGSAGGFLPRRGLMHAAVPAPRPLLRQGQQRGPASQARTWGFVHLKHFTHQQRARLLFSRSAAFSKEE